MSVSCTPKVVEHRIGARAIGELPPKDVIDVWVITLASRLEIMESECLLSNEEQSRAAHFRFERDAARFRRCHAALRILLGRYLNRPAPELLFGAGALGKPYLACESPLRFNLAHSRNMAVIAFATLGEVGVDLEAVATEVSGESTTAGQPCSADARARAFLRLWTRKEAVFKALGCGLSSPLDSVNIAENNIVSANLETSAEPTSYWRVEDLELGPGFVGAVAAPPGDWIIQQWMSANSILPV